MQNLVVSKKIGSVNSFRGSAHPLFTPQIQRYTRDRSQALMVQAVKVKNYEQFLRTFEDVAGNERIRLHNLKPFVGSRRKRIRRGRGYGGKGGSCGFGQNGQKSRSGETIRPGFEGEQMPLYRRQPKLKGIAGGMKKGVPKHMILNLRSLQSRYPDGGEINLQKLKEDNVIQITGNDRKLPLKVLGIGDVNKPYKITAASVSESARQKIEAAGGSIELVQDRIKWTKQYGKELKEKGEKKQKIGRKQKKALKKEQLIKDLQAQGIKVKPQKPIKQIAKKTGEKDRQWRRKLRQLKDKKQEDKTNKYEKYLDSEEYKKKEDQALEYIQKVTGIKPRDEAESYKYWVGKFINAIQNKDKALKKY